MHQGESAVAPPSHQHLPPLYPGHCAPRWPGHPQRCPQWLGEEVPGQKEGPIRQDGPSPDWSLLFHRCCLPHWYFRDPPQPICVARPWGDASPTPCLHHLCPFPFGDPRRAQGSGKPCDTSFSPRDTHICLSKDGRPGRYHPVTLSCLAPRSMTPSASTQKTSKGGHLWLLFPSQQVPGEDIGHLRWEYSGGGGSIWDWDSRHDCQAGRWEKWRWSEFWLSFSPLPWRW